MVGLSVFSYRSIRDALKISKKIRSFGLPVIWGGQIPTSLYKECLDTGVVDYIVIGEGEVTFLELAGAIISRKNIRDIAGLAYMKDGKLMVTGQRELADLADFPTTDWTLVDPEKYSKRFLGCEHLYYLYAGKGCPCRCAFCENNKYSRFVHRNRPISVLIEEIKYLQENYDCDGVYFSDENWYPDRKDLREFCNALKTEKIEIFWGMQTRADTLSRDDIELMYSAGCRWAYFGIESGSSEIQKKMRKNIDLEKVRQTFEICKEIGINATAMFIIGYIGETPQQLKETMQLAKELGIGNSNCCILAAFPGCGFYDELRQKGLIEKREDLLSWTKVEFAEVVTEKFSEIPDRDLMVVRSFLRWSAFIGVGREHDFRIAKNLIIDEIKYCFTQSPYNLIVGGFHAAKEFFSVTWYANAYPKILKKYGLKD